MNSTTASRDLSMLTDWRVASLLAYACLCVCGAVSVQ